MIGPFTALTSYNQFILHDAKKRPFNHRSGTPDLDAHDPSNWLSYAEAARIAGTRADLGVGFVFTANDPFFFLDIDDCAENGAWSPVALEMLQVFSGAAVEVSRSGQGLHVIGSYSGVTPEHRCKNKKHGMELYTSGRYAALTQSQASGCATFSATDQLEWVVSRFFAPSAAAQTESGPAAGPAEEWDGYTEDGPLIHRARRASSATAAFGGGASFDDLWTGNEDALGRAYPDNYGGGRAYDGSGADAALAQHLAFWTGNDSARIERIMRLSALVRDKWDSHPSYLSRTISFATSRQTEFHKKRVVPEEAKVVSLRSGYQFLSAAQQEDYFDGCVYVCDSHKVLVPNGDQLKPDQFKAMYGGFVFGLDADNGKTTTNAWLAFTESQALSSPKANSTIFLPGQKTGTIQTDAAGYKRANVWADPCVDRMVGDPSPFLTHLSKLLPDVGDQLILLRYMAAVVQHQGTKFQWCPLIQGVAGNGKSLFTRCVYQAVGWRYTYTPRADDLAGKFNDWLVNKVVIGVEDVYLTREKLHIIETLKPMITSTGEEGYEVEGKNAPKFMTELKCNFILNTNHKNAVPKTDDDRRFAVFHTAQQSLGDLKASGLDGDYFPKLYSWLRGGGYAIVSEMLHTYELPENWVSEVACHRAPVTTSTAEAVSLSVGGVEQEVLEAIESGRPGFCGGWISSKALDNLLEEIRAARKIPRNRRRALAASLGYDWHPALHDGRVPRKTTVDGSKVRLYVAATSTELLEIAAPRDVVSRYEADQAV